MFWLDSWGQINFVLIEHVFKETSPHENFPFFNLIAISLFQLYYSNIWNASNWVICNFHRQTWTCKTTWQDSIVVFFCWYIYFVTLCFIVKYLTSGSLLFVSVRQRRRKRSRGECKIIFCLTWDAIEAMRLTHSQNRLYLCDPGKWRYPLKTLLAWLVIGDTYGYDFIKVVMWVV